jgi:hypothetical protein
MRAKIGLPALTAAGAAGFEVGREKGIEASRLGPSQAMRLPILTTNNTNLQKIWL